MFEFHCPRCSETVSALHSATGSEVICPHCGRLALVPTPPAPPARLETRARGGSIAVWLKNQPKPLWPQVCACCGKQPDTEIEIVHKKFEDHRTRTSVHYVPSCYFCKVHQEAGYEFDRYGAGCAAGVVLVALVSWSALSSRHVLGGNIEDVYSVIFCVAAWVILYAIARAKISQHKREAAEHIMGERCTGPVFVSFERTYSGVLRETFIDRFRFTSSEYGSAFRRENVASIPSA